MPGSNTLTIAAAITRPTTIHSAMSSSSCDVANFIPSPRRSRSGVEAASVEAPPVVSQQPPPDAPASEPQQPPPSSPAPPAPPSAPSVPAEATLTLKAAPVGAATCATARRTAAACTASPVAMPEATAATGRTTVRNGPSMAYEIASESTPVSGVDTRNEAVAPGDAPCRRSPTAAGITPHEHSGSGAPTSAARTIDPMPPPPTHRFITASGTSARISAVATIPSASHGAASSDRSSRLFKNRVTASL